MVFTYAIWILALYGFVRLLADIWRIIDARLERHIDDALMEDRLSELARIYDGEREA